MARGKDERHNPNRKVSKQEKGMTTFDMGGGATVQRILSPEAQAENKYMDRTGIDPMTNENLYDDDSVPNNPELRYEPNDDIGPYDGHDYEDDDEY